MSKAILCLSVYSTSYSIVVIVLAQQISCEIKLEVSESENLLKYEATLVTLFLIYKQGRKLCGKNGHIAKRKAAKLEADARKFEKLKQRFEKNVVTEPEKEKKEPAKVDVIIWQPFTYEP